MCGILGYFPFGEVRNKERKNKEINIEAMKLIARGRDAFGMHGINENGLTCSSKLIGKIDGYKAMGVTNKCLDLAAKIVDEDGGRTWAFLANARACPTTEYHGNTREEHAQPYRRNGWHIVHNGTISNDKELGFKTPSNIDSESIAYLLGTLTEDPFYVEDPLDAAYLLASVFDEAMHKLKGSFAVIAVHEKVPGVVFYATNYKPLYIHTSNNALIISSIGETSENCVKVEPYTVHGMRTDKRELFHTSLYAPRNRKVKQKALMICSSGLDSTVAASKLIEDGYDVTLMHYNYNCRASNPEIKAIHKIAEALNVSLVIKDMSIYSASASPILNHTDDIAQGETGAEFAHEWVPARNLVMLSIATAYAEEHGFDIIGLGNNLEESGAYPDNEPEFIKMFNQMLPYAVADGKKLAVVSPVGNLMKHEIVALGLRIGAPMELTWSCYNNGETHCGACGPCYMRKKAFEINGEADPVFKETK